MGLEWEITILIYLNTSNMVALTILDNMELTHQWEWEEEVECLLVDRKVAFMEVHLWIQEAEVTINQPLEVAFNLKITHLATVNLTPDMVNTNIHLQMVIKEPHQFLTVPMDTLPHQLTSIQTH